MWGEKVVAKVIDDVTASSHLDEEYKLQNLEDISRSFCIWNNNQTIEANAHAHSSWP